jgi:hypothetical protein
MNTEEQSYRIGISELSEKLGYKHLKTFWRRVNSLPVLKTELGESGYIKGQKEFTPKQMKLICDRIGYPECD